MYKMLSMKKLLLLFLLIISFYQLKASHTAAVDLSYVRLSNGDYQFILKLYRDCAGIPAPSPATVNLSYTSSCGSGTLNLPDYSWSEVSQICDTLINNTFCQGGTQAPGIEEHIYKGTITLAPCADWRFEYTLCCRNSAIDNLQSPSGYNIFTFAELNNSVRFNHSVDFKNRPIFYACNGVPVNYSFAAVDSNNDNVTYTLVNPRSSGGTSIPFVVPYNAATPFGWGFSFNSSTGTVSFTPTTSGQVVMSVIAEERDPGTNQLVGRTQKDIQFVVINCPPQNYTPYTSGVNWSPTNFTYNACPSQPFCFDILGTSGVPTSPLTFTFFPGFGTGGGLTTTTNLDSTFGQYCWTTGLPPAGTYTFNIDAAAQTCPIKTINSFTYTINFIDNIDPTINCSGTDTLYLNNLGWAVPDTTLLNITASDNCGLDTVWFSTDTLRCTDLGFNTFKAYVRDNQGNMDSCSFNLIVLDTIVPSVLCTDTTIYLNNLGVYYINGTYIDGGSTDNCTPLLAVSQSIFNCNHVGVNQVTLYVTDQSGNVDSCTANVTVFDTLGPVAICLDTTVYLNDSGFVIIDSTFVNGGSFDACGIFTLSQSLFTCADIGVNLVTVTVTDPSSNFTQCIAQVTVLDTNKAVFYCPNDTSIDLGPICDFTVPNYYDSLSFDDNCDSGVLILSQNPAPGTVIDISNNGAFAQSLRVTVYATDSSGNSDSCSFLIDLTCTGELEIPQFYSPNGDGQNDLWEIRGIQNFPENNTKIFNRLGTLVYEAEGYNNTWGGEINRGQGLTLLKSSEALLPSGTYFYIVDLKNDRDPYVGYVHIRK